MLKIDSVLFSCLLFSALKAKVGLRFLVLALHL